MKLLHGDCLDLLPQLPDDSVQLIMTSPPYANQRKIGTPADQYVEWFLPISQQLFRVLKPTGTLIVNIKEKVVDGERSTYVHDLIRGMKDQGWRWTEEYIWHKKNSAPGYWKNRFRDAWESCHQFNKQKDFDMYQQEVKVPIGDWSQNAASLKDTDRSNKNVGSKVSTRDSNWIGKTHVLPSNVLHLATECSNTGHSAAFPKALPEFFIKLFSQEGDTVLDPFLGSGTTLIVGEQLKREGIGMELDLEYFKLAEERLK